MVVNGASSGSEAGPVDVPSGNAPDVDDPPDAELLGGAVAGVPDGVCSELGALADGVVWGSGGGVACFGGYLVAEGAEGSGCEPSCAAIAKARPTMASTIRNLFIDL